MTPSRWELLDAIAECQNLFGSIEAAYQNDRAPDRASKVLALTKRGFDLCLKIRGRVQP